MRRLYLLVIFVLLLLPVPAQAVRLFTSGFEENGTLTTTMFATASGTTPSTGSTSPHSGTYRLNTTAAAASSSTKAAMTAHGTGTSVFARCYISASTAAPSATTTILSDTSAAPTLGFQVTHVITTGVLTLTNVPGATTPVSTVTALSANTWYRLEVDHVLHATTGTMTLRLYDDSLNLLETLVLDGVAHAGENTLPATTPTVTGVNIGKTGSTTTYSYDDCAINDATGSVQTGAPGPGKVFLLVPDSNISIKSEDSAGGTDNGTFANLDDLPGTPNDADYNAVDTALDAADAIGANGTDRLGLTNLGAEVPSDATINVVDVYARVGSNQTGATHMQLTLWDDASSALNSGSIACNVNGWVITAGTDVYRLAGSGAGKSKSSLDTYNVGYSPLTDTMTLKPRRVSALWVNVEWTEAVAAASTLQYPTFFGGIIR